jgi:hypothetical protein
LTAESDKVANDSQRFVRALHLLFCNEALLNALLYGFYKRSMQEQKKELFESYEIKNWEFSPRVYKIIGASVLVNLLFVFVAGQTDLTQKGCNTPFGSGICQVLNTVYIGGTLLGTDDEYVSKEYVKNELEDADITYVDVSSETPPLKYPEGYFAIANPNDFAAMQNADFSSMPTDMSGFPTYPTVPTNTDLMNTPQVVPTPNDNAVNGTIPDSPFSYGANPIAKSPAYKSPKIRNYTTKLPKIKNESPKTLPSDEELAGKTEDKETKDKTGEKQPDKTQPPVESDAVTAVEINKKPLEDFAETVLAKTAAENKQKIDLTKPFMVVMDGVITKDGKFDKDPKKSKFVKSTGDEEMVNVAKSAIEAIGNSGFLGYLRNLDVEKINFTLIQDDNQIYAIIASEQKSPERANTLTSGFNGLLKSAFLLDSIGTKKLGDDEKILLNSAKTSSKDKQFILNFAMPKKDAHDMINRNLEKEAKKRAEKNNQPNSTAQNADLNSKTNK